MKLHQTLTALILPALFSFAGAQLLTNGNSQFPSCAASCTLLNQAAQACGGTATANQQIWSCFCQSGYLTTLYSSPNGICDAFCTNPSDNQQVMTWFKSNCGTDDGASEHANTGAGATTVVVTSTSTSAAVTVAATTSNAPLPTTSSSGGTVEPDTHPSSGGTWWNKHYKWVIMLIALFVGLLLFAAIAIWLKRRHDRKADQIREGFNAGITTRSTAAMSTVGVPGRDGAATADTSYASQSQVMAGGLEAGSGSGRNSPARTREAFMPYGYSYTRSESRLGSHGDLAGRKSPLARGETPVKDLEKEVGMGSGATPESAAPRRSRRVLVRERGAESPEVEKSFRL